jgi:hypothetical protein
MTTIDATVQKGRIVTREPVEWPDGAEVRVTLCEPDEDIFGDSPESIARWLALAASIPAPTISDAEWEVMQSERRAARDREQAETPVRESRLFKDFP